MKTARIGRAGIGLATALILITGLSACNSDSQPTAQRTGITVLAAASLTDVMPQLVAAYAQEQPDVDVTTSFGGSQVFVEQLKSGAPGDVLVAADEQSLVNLDGSGRDLSEYQVVATNQIVLAVAPGNPANISNLADAAANQRLAICAPAVPCGRATQRVLDAAGLQVQGASQENDVRSVLSKVSAGQVDAGFVYATDAVAAQSQGVTSIPLDDPAPNRYPALVTTNSDQAEIRQAATAFQQWLSGAQAQQIFAEAGFGPCLPGNTPAPTPSASAAAQGGQ
ncbi:molybdate ABC transporter substrate-binding protein [Acaricomes phytoseiuli]|uniref:molybdate ABC transporter substrate-binding protein n=1 Tax=Acaricomes phytoseiuli TaxID=291968 RepID=UPI00222144CD|nr:molybdate ABC transporter substrate-binding protein [Acaricomes phytoseiuli]MCW1248793.1 molybdate ABC transporter substrate-binding protein [Acaricomes phytoseiuli]